MNYYNYFTEIEETFIRRRGKNLLLSPLDWALIESWQEREVPLHIILRGIERVFDTIDKQPARKRSVKSLFYCKEEIEAQFAEWLESQVGKNGAESPESGLQSSPADGQPAKNELFSREAIEAHLEEVSADLSQALKAAENVELRETLERVLHRLAELAGNYESAEKLEESLEKLDAILDESLLKAAETDDLKAETAQQLASYKNKMEREVFERTLSLMILKTLRERAALPRLSLFYL
ncbi:MAG TPA: hypothetical protein VGC97_00525 [Pyrinomonadaceae bacterium]|jgi:hypothetical protein